MEFFKSGKIYEFMGKRFQFLSLSIILVVASITILTTKGLNLGIDFAGGTIIQLKYDKVAPIPQIREILKKDERFNNVIVKNFGSQEEIVINYLSSSTSINNDIADQIGDILKDTGNFEVRRSDIVGPKVGAELQEKGIISLILALVVILAYVSYRFEVRFAVSSILALIHDITITLGVISLFEIDFNLDTLAALLTILGYSLNDTIIVFDRIREGIKNSKSNILETIINESVTNTLSRTILTSITTFFVVFTLFIFGAEIIKGFSFALMIGVVVGTYSSIFIAATFLVQLKFSVKNYRENESLKLKKNKEKDRIRAMYNQGTV